MIAQGFALRAIHKIMAIAYKRMDLVADIGDCMRKRLSAYPSPAARSRLWPWALSEPAAVPETDLAQREALFGKSKLGIMYSGNFGRAHSFSELLTVARQMRASDAHFSLGIRGNRVAELKRAITTDDCNVSFAPFAPADQLEARLSAADIHVVSLRPEWTGTVVPSKFFGALAAGRPVLFIGSEACCIAQIIRRHGLGWVCPPGAESAVASQLSELAADPSLLRGLQERCHQTYKKLFSRDIVIDAFDLELRNLLPIPDTAVAEPQTSRSRSQTAGR
jgi:hypothetical protein